MMKTTYFFLAITVLVVLFASACGGSTPAPTQAVPPPVEVVPTQAPPEVVEPSQPPAATAQTFAPACQAAPSCAAPDMTDIAGEKNYCVEKIPYQNIAVEPGTTFEPLDPTGEFKCQDSGTVVDGKNIITCAGQQLVAYELKLTSSACAANALATGTGQCQEGLGYDAAQNCCAPLDAAATGSVTITVHMGACPLPQ